VNPWFFPLYNSKLYFTQNPSGSLARFKNIDLPRLTGLLAMLTNQAKK